MRNAFKVAKWEFKRNMKNKSFLIGLFITPVLIVGFMVLSGILGDTAGEETTVRVFVNDNIGAFEMLQQTAERHTFNWEMQPSNISEQEVKEKLQNVDNTAYIFLDEKSLEQQVIPVYTSTEIDRAFINQVQVLAAPLKTLQLKQLGLSNEQLAAISQEIIFQEISAEDLAAGADDREAKGDLSPEDIMARVIPGAFAGVVFLSIIFSGMYIFQSASQEKKDKVAEIILSSITPDELMQGKIIGYFLLGMVQTLIILVFAVPIVVWKYNIPLMRYLLVPEIILYLLIALLGYLLFAALFVGVGATMADITTAGNFQGMVMMLPFLPLIFIGPVANDPSGLIAQIASYIPFASPGILLLRLSLLEEWPWLEIIIALFILIVSIWFFMKLAGKIFKAGILMYGKNATPREIWKWIRA